MTPLATAAVPILQAAQLAAENGSALLAIDGRCGSGKSTLAEFLAGQLGCRVVHTDDFYLPLAARCANWQEQPGANIDFIRLRNEVLQPLLRGKTALFHLHRRIQNSAGTADFFVHPEYFTGSLDGSRAWSRCVRCGYCNPDCTGNFRSVFVFDFLCTDAAI